MTRRTPGIRLPVESTFDPRGRIELGHLGQRLVVPVGTIPIGPLAHESLRAHLLLDQLADCVRRRVHLRALRGALVVDVRNIDDLIELLEQARDRAAALRRAA